MRTGVSPELSIGNTSEANNFTGKAYRLFSLYAPPSDPPPGQSRTPPKTLAKRASKRGILLCNPIPGRLSGVLSADTDQTQPCVQSTSRSRARTSQPFSDSAPRFFQLRAAGQRVRIRQRSSWQPKPLRAPLSPDPLTSKRRPPLPASSVFPMAGSGLWPARVATGTLSPVVVPTLRLRSHQVRQPGRSAPLTCSRPPARHPVAGMTGGRGGRYTNKTLDNRSNGRHYTTNL